MSTQVAGLRRFAARKKTDGWQPTGEPTFVVGGAKGGSGTSTITAMLALASAADGRRTLIIDTDDGVGSLHRMLGVSAKHGIVSLQDPSIAVESVLVQVTEHCWLIPGGIGDQGTAAPLGTAERRAVLRRIAQIYPTFDVIVLDAGSRLDGIIAAAGRGAWRFIGVAGVEPVALASAYALVKAVETRWPGAPIEILINKHDEVRATAGFEQIRAASEHFLGRTVKCAGSIALDLVISNAALAGKPLKQLADAGQAGATTAQIAVRLLAELDDAPQS